jgi:hypothetical protein
MKRMLMLGGLAALAATTFAAKPASADECRDGRYVAPVAVFNRFDADRDGNRSFAQDYNRAYRRDNDRNDRNDRNDHNDHNRDRNDRQDGHDRR